MASKPIYSKNIKILFLKNQLTDCLDTWYVAFGTRVLPGAFKLCCLVDLYLFNTKVKFGHLGFYMEKSENYYFFENIAG